MKQKLNSIITLLYRGENDNMDVLNLNLFTLFYGFLFYFMLGMVSESQSKMPKTRKSTLQSLRRQQPLQLSFVGGGGDRAALANLGVVGEPTI